VKRRRARHYALRAWLRNRNNLINNKNKRQLKKKRHTVNNNILVSRFNRDLIWLEMRNINRNLGNETFSYSNDEINFSNLHYSVPETICHLP
jgi:hypothetical protein